MTTMTDLQIDKWVQEANDDTNREFRQAVHTTLLAISSDNALKNNMVLKGGILLTIRYRSNRFTKDIDLSTTNHLSSMVPEDIISKSIKALHWRSTH
ncbi:MAG: nucleotidyl transferase AbiEii/AbiGii toxin family protein [Cellvibrionales bacterium]|nr:nucleotidyl transferase AbiEii/AbiGii toxin family protein [Cellvibrionales bacterium]